MGMTRTREITMVIKASTSHRSDGVTLPGDYALQLTIQYRHISRHLLNLSQMLRAQYHFASLGNGKSFDVPGRQLHNFNILLADTWRVVLTSAHCFLQHLTHKLLDLIADRHYCPGTRFCLKIPPALLAFST